MLQCRQNAAGDIWRCC